MNGFDLNGAPFAFVAVGTDHHPFQRLMDWVGAWASESSSLKLLVQSGNSEPPSNVDFRDYLGYDDVIDTIDRSLGVVCHGGPATILEVRRSGRLPIVVPRRAGLGEHVNDHQWFFSRRMAEEGQIRLCETQDEWTAALHHLAREPDAFRIDTESEDHVLETVETFALLVEPYLRRSVARRNRRSR